MEKELRIKLGSETIETGLQHVEESALNLLEMNDYKPIYIESGPHSLSILVDYEGSMLVSLSKYFAHTDGEGYDSYDFYLETSGIPIDGIKKPAKYRLSSDFVIRPASIYQKTDLSNNRSLVMAHLSEALTIIHMAQEHIAQE